MAHNDQALVKSNVNLECEVCKARWPTELHKVRSAESVQRVLCIVHLREHSGMV